jgi:hypothetical protein
VKPAIQKLKVLAVVGDPLLAGPPSPSTIHLVVPPAINKDLAILEIARAIAVSNDVYVGAATMRLMLALTLA